MTNDRRVITDRSSDASDQLDRIPLRQGGTPSFAGKVYDGGNKPDSTPAWYLTHPVDFSGDESEGGTFTATADTSRSIPVLVLNHPPAVDDILIAELVGGKWIADGGHTEECGCTWVCKGVEIPLSDLLLTIDPPWPTSGDPLGSCTLEIQATAGVYNGTWRYCEPDGDASDRFVLICTSFGPWFRFGNGASKDDCSPAGTTLLSTPVSYRGLPFQLVYRDTSGDTPRTFTITKVGGPQTYCVTVCPVGACGPIAGASVTVTDGDGNEVASGETGDGGCVTLDIGRKGTYTVTITADGYKDYSATQPLICARIGVCLQVDADTLKVTDSALFPDGLDADWDGTGWQAVGTTTLKDVTDGGIPDETPFRVYYRLSCQGGGGTGHVYQLLCFPGDAEEDNPLQYPLGGTNQPTETIESCNPISLKWKYTGGFNAPGGCCLYTLTGKNEVTVEWTQ